METTERLFVAYCPSKKCNAPIRIHERRYPGGFNDDGGVIIECSKCKTVFAHPVKNATDFGPSVGRNGRQLDSWMDDMPESFITKYKLTSASSSKPTAALILGYEKPPKPVWQPSSTPLYLSGSTNLESLAYEALERNRATINQNFGDYANWYLKGRHSTTRSFVFVDYKIQRKNAQAVFAKTIETEQDLTGDNLYLIHHSDVDFPHVVDGIYTRDELLVFLERFLNRWRYTANEVLLFVPFIGFQYKNSEEAVRQLWDWLEVNVDSSKTRLITRKGTLNLLKNAQNNTDVPFDELQRLGLLEPFVEKMSTKGTTFLQKSHAKYYVGVYDDYVEVLVGSFNIHAGSYFENITFRQYDKAFFRERYLHMLSNFKYAEPSGNESVHYMEVGKKNGENHVMDMTDILTKIQKIK